MNKRYRALGTLSSLLKVLAWINLIVGIAVTILSAAVGALQARRGVSQVLVNVPLLYRTNDWLGATLLAVGVLVSALLTFLLFLALAEFIQVALAIEQNTRETSYFLKGETQLPPPPAAASWEEEEQTNPAGK